MKKLYPTLLLAFLALVSPVCSQSFQIGFGTGKLAYSQKPIKDFNTEVSRLVPFETAFTDNFPATLFFQGEIGYNFRSFFLGVNYAYNSTGSRLTRSDYSGSYYFDVILTGHMMGLSPGFFSSLSNRWKLYYMCDAGIIYSSLSMDESIALGDYYDHNEQFEWEATSYFAKPHLRLSYELYNVKLSLSAGYLIDFDSPFHLKENKDVILKNSRYKNVTTGWNGFITGLSVYFVL
jgi:hypothetical protein